MSREPSMLIDASRRLLAVPTFWTSKSTPSFASTANNFGVVLVDCEMYRRSPLPDTVNHGPS
jgi:hypothetical protein